MIKGINHLGVVVKSIDEVVAFLKETFGTEEIKRIEFPELKQISAIVRIGDGCLELMNRRRPMAPWAGTWTPRGEDSITSRCCVMTLRPLVRSWRKKVCRLSVK